MPFTRAVPGGTFPFGRLAGTLADVPNAAALRDVHAALPSWPDSRILPHALIVIRRWPATCPSHAPAMASETVRQNYYLSVFLNWFHLTFSSICYKILSKFKKIF
ncbi:MAG: hypothetical protein LBT40_16605 [Deltaproteobacteria bacterium]|jgi:hypothetical protein|nr:hypothetical protein [Deltaproteobacteria bacterium]